MNSLNVSPALAACCSFDPLKEVGDQDCLSCAPSLSLSVSLSRSLSLSLSLYMYVYVRLAYDNVAYSWDFTPGCVEEGRSGVVHANFRSGSWRQRGACLADIAHGCSRFPPLQEVSASYSILAPSTNLFADARREKELHSMPRSCQSHRTCLSACASPMLL